MARKLTVVVSQGQSANPLKRKLEEDIIAGLLFERGLEVTVVPHLYDLTADGTGTLCLQGLTGDVVVLAWLFPRAAFWTLDRNGIRGEFGATTLLDPTADDEDEEEAAAVDEAKNGDKPRVIDRRPLPNRKIYCVDLRVRNEPQPFIDEVRRILKEVNTQTVSLLGWIGGSPRPEQMERFLNPTAPGSLPVVEPPPSESIASTATEVVQPVRIDDDARRRWYPVIDYSRCTNCMECIDFCLFGVYGVDRADTILVEQPDNCRKGCPACSRVCPENAIIFPQHKTPSIAGGLAESLGGLKIDLSKLFGAPDALEQAVLERDVELVAVGRDAVGATVGIPKRQPDKDSATHDELDALLDELDKMDY